MACSRGQQALGKPGQHGDGGVTTPACSACHDTHLTLGEHGGAVLASSPCSVATREEMGMHAHANPSSMARKSRHLWADTRMEGGNDGVLPAVHDDSKTREGCSGSGQANEDPQEDGPLKTR